MNSECVIWFIGQLLVLVYEYLIIFQNGGPWHIYTITTAYLLFIVILLLWFVCHCFFFSLYNPYFVDVFLWISLFIYLLRYSLCTLHEIFLKISKISSVFYRVLNKLILWNWKKKDQTMTKYDIYTKSSQHAGWDSKQKSDFFQIFWYATKNPEIIVVRPIPYVKSIVL